MNFKFPKYYKTLSAGEKEEWNDFKNIVEEIQKKFVLTNVLNPIISNFNLIESKQKPHFLNSWQIMKNSRHFIICLIEYEIQYQEVHVYGALTKNMKHKYFFGYLTTTKDFDNTLIRPETLSDKISELFNPVEVDINGFNKFNRKYYVLSNNEPKFLHAMNSNVLNYIASQNGLQIEFDGQRCLFRLDKALNLEETFILCEIGLKLDELLNGNSGS